MSKKKRGFPLSIFHSQLRHFVAHKSEFTVHSALCTLHAALFDETQLFGEKGDREVFPRTHSVTK